eukprot:2371148-Rhodomonas_salina.1
MRNTCVQQDGKHVCQEVRSGACAYSQEAAVSEEDRSVARALAAAYSQPATVTTHTPRQITLPRLGSHIHVSGHPIPRVSALATISPTLFPQDSTHRPPQPQARLNTRCSTPLSLPSTQPLWTLQPPSSSLLHPLRPHLHGGVDALASLDELLDPRPQRLHHAGVLVQKLPPERLQPRLQRRVRQLHAARQGREGREEREETSVLSHMTQQPAPLQNPHSANEARAHATGGSGGADLGVLAGGGHEDGGCLPVEALPRQHLPRAVRVSTGHHVSAPDSERARESGCISTTRGPPSTRRGAQRKRIKACSFSTGHRITRPEGESLGSGTSKRISGLQRVSLRASSCSCSTIPTVNTGQIVAGGQDNLYLLAAEAELLRGAERVERLQHRTANTQAVTWDGPGGGSSWAPTTSAAPRAAAPTLGPAHPTSVLVYPKARRYTPDTTQYEPTRKCQRLVQRQYHVR